MVAEIQKIIVPKEQAVFWMDKNGFWHNEHGRLEHPKLIRYFNSSIRKDENGYYLYQKTDEFEEKVYFCHGETALFVVDFKVTDHAIELALNNRTTIALCPDELFSLKDALYVQTLDHKIKFTDRALVKLSKFMVENEGELFLTLNNKSYPILSGVDQQ